MVNGFKSGRREGKGSKRYYGYEGAGQGSRTLLRDDATLYDIVTVATAALNYLPDPTVSIRSLSELPAHPDGQLSAAQEPSDVTAGERPG